MSEETPELESLAQRVRASRAALRNVRAEKDASNAPKPLGDARAPHGNGDEPPHVPQPDSVKPRGGTGR